MAKYESKKNPGTFLTTDGAIDEKTKTMAVTMDDGKEKRISVSTLKRWWKKIEEAEAEQAEEAEAEAEEAEAEEAEAEEVKAEQAEEAEAEAEEAEAEAEEAEAEEVKAEQTEVKESSTAKCLEATKIMEDIFNTINYIYFEDSLPKSAILVQNTPREYARHTMKKFDKAVNNSEFTYEISIGAKFLDKPIEHAAAVLFHEMIHIYCVENTISDTCQNGRYHNGKFKKECESRGLLTEYDLANGYAYVLPTEDFIKALKDAGIDMSMTFAHIEPIRKSSARDGRKMLVYECPCCGQHFKAWAGLEVKCGKCDVIMECS